MAFRIHVHKMNLLIWNIQMDFFCSLSSDWNCGCFFLQFVAHFFCVSILLSFEWVWILVYILCCCYVTLSFFVIVEFCIEIERIDSILNCLCLYSSICKSKTWWCNTFRDAFIYAAFPLSFFLLNFFFFQIKLHMLQQCNEISMEIQVLSSFFSELKREENVDSIMEYT